MLAEPTNEQSPMKTASILLAASLLIAAGNASAFAALKPDPELDWAQEYATGQQIRDVMWQLQVDNATACGEHVVGQTGLQLALGKHRWNSLEAYYESQGWSYGNTVVQVATGSPADLAGLRVGDVLTRVDGKRIKERKDHDDAFENQERLEKAEKRRDSFVVEFTRDGVEQTVTLSPVKVCDVRVRALHVHYAIANPPESNEAMVSPEYLAITRDPTDVRILATHEFAHHFLGHNRRDGLMGMAANVAHFAGAGQAAHVVSGAVGWSQRDDNELAADVASIDLLASSGIDAARILDLYTRLHDATRDGRIDGRVLHPISDERLAALRAKTADPTASTTDHHEDPKS